MKNEETPIFPDDPRRQSPRSNGWIISTDVPFPKNLAVAGVYANHFKGVAVIRANPIGMCEFAVPDHVLERLVAGNNRSLDRGGKEYLVFPNYGRRVSPS